VHPRKFIRDSLGFAITQYVIRGLLMGRAIVAARLLGPLPYGAWNAIQLVMDYGTTLPPMVGCDNGAAWSCASGDVSVGSRGTVDPRALRDLAVHRFRSGLVGMAADADLGLRHGLDRSRRVGHEARDLIAGALAERGAVGGEEHHGVERLGALQRLPVV